MLFKRLKYNEKAIIPLTVIQLKAREAVKKKVKEGYYAFQDIDCVICESKDSEDVANRDRYGLKYSVKICKNCGLLYTSPRMNQVSFNEFYELEYRKLYLGAENPFPGYFKQQYNRGEAIFNYLDAIDILNSSEQEVLEIGCSSGGILSYFKEKGFNTIGVDLDKDYVNYGREKYGLNLIHGTIHDLPDDYKPDIIIYSHVLEHILDLDFELATISKIMKPSTKIYIEVPGIKNIHQAYRCDILLYFQNAHTIHFSLTSLKNLMSKYGFELLKGDEFVKSVFQPSRRKIAIIESDYDGVISYLKKIERKRKIKVLNPKYLVFKLKHSLARLKKHFFTNRS